MVPFQVFHSKQLINNKVINYELAFRAKALSVIKVQPR